MISYARHVVFVCLCACVCVCVCVQEHLCFLLCIQSGCLIPFTANSSLNYFLVGSLSSKHAPIPSLKVDLSAIILWEIFPKIPFPFAQFTLSNSPLLLLLPLILHLLRYHCISPMRAVCLVLSVKRYREK